MSTEDPAINEQRAEEQPTNNTDSPQYAVNDTTQQIPEKPPQPTSSLLQEPAESTQPLSTDKDEPPYDSAYLF